MGSSRRYDLRGFPAASALYAPLPDDYSSAAAEMFEAALRERDESTELIGMSCVGAHDVETMVSDDGTLTGQTLEFPTRAAVRSDSGQWNLDGCLRIKLRWADDGWQMTCGFDIESDSPVS